MVLQTIEIYVSEFEENTVLVNDRINTYLVSVRLNKKYFGEQKKVFTFHRESKPYLQRPPKKISPIYFLINHRKVLLTN